MAADAFRCHESSSLSSLMQLLVQTMRTWCDDGVLVWCWSRKKCGVEVEEEHGEFAVNLDEGNFSLREPIKNSDKAWPFAFYHLQKVHMSCFCVHTVVHTLAVLCTRWCTPHCQWPHLFNSRNTDSLKSHWNLRGKRFSYSTLLVFLLSIFRLCSRLNSGSGNQRFIPCYLWLFDCNSQC